MRTVITTLLAAAFLSAPALAQDSFDTAPPPAVTVGGQVALLNDYRFRGLTQTNEDAALQGTVTATHESGLSAGVFVSNIAGRTPGDSLFGYGGVEVDLFGGYSRTIASGLIGEVGATYYLYPDNLRGRSTDYIEPYVALSYDLGPAQARLSAAYAPSGQAGLGDRDSLYASGDLKVGVPTTPLTVVGHFGYTTGALGTYNLRSADRDYFDWSLGMEATEGPIVIGLRYLDTDVSDRFGFASRTGADATVVVSAGVQF